MNKLTKKLMKPWLNLTFYTMISIWILNIATSALNNNQGIVTGNLILMLMWSVSIISTFIISIISLSNKLKPKSFYIIALVISSWLLLTLLIGFYIGFMIAYVN